MISVPRRHWFRCLAVLLYGGPLFVATPFAAQAEDSAFHLGWFRDSDFHELDSKYLFGSFTREHRSEKKGSARSSPIRAPVSASAADNMRRRSPSLSWNTRQLSFSSLRSVRRFPTTTSVVYLA